MSRFSRPGHYGLDTETTGLGLRDSLFSIILADEHQGVYFNFNHAADHLGNFSPLEVTIPRAWLGDMAPIFENPESTFYIHNAKFDLSMLAKEELEVLGTVHCTLAFERVIKNNFMDYSLEACAKRRGLEKDSRVEEYIRKHKLVTKVRVPGKDKAVELWHFDKVPFDIIAPYGERDAVLHRAIGVNQLEQLAALDRDKPVAAPSLAPLMRNERQLTKVCYRMEKAGIRVDRRYVQSALTFTQKAAEAAQANFAEMTGIPYENSPTTIKAAFEKFGIALPLTPTGKPCTKKEVLDAMENPLADKIREIRTHEKLCSTYYSSFLYHADENDLVHANIRQAGTETGRFSYSDPNLQNLPKEDDEADKLKPFTVRKSFVPGNSDYCFVPIDFKQQEFRMMLDYAGERALIDEIMAGADVHDATAKLLGISRKYAKTINFGLLYGMGNDKLAKALKITVRDARDLRYAYFDKLPNVQAFIRNVMRTGESRGYVWNWLGYRNHISAAEYAYVLPNHVIQGGCAQVLRLAMVRLDAYIRRYCLRSQMLIQVHDELLFQMHKNEFEHVDKLREIMETVYVPKNGMYLQCSVEHSWKSWGKCDMKSGGPFAA